MADDQNVNNDDVMSDDLDDISDSDISDDTVIDDTDDLSGLDDDATTDKTRRNPLLELEEEAVAGEDFSEPKGLANTDPGIVDEAIIDAEMWREAVDDDIEEEDIEALGYHVEDGTSGTSDDTDSLGDI